MDGRYWSGSIVLTGSTIARMSGRNTKRVVKFSTYLTFIVTGEGGVGRRKCEKWARHAGDLVLYIYQFPVRREFRWAATSGGQWVFGYSTLR